MQLFVIYFYSIREAAELEGCVSCVQTETELVLEFSMHPVKSGAIF